MKGFADRLLVYITLYISACLTKIGHKSKGEADKILYSFAIENFAMPGDKTFALGGLCSAPANRGDAGLFCFSFSSIKQTLTKSFQTETLKAYLTQIRQETYVRFLDLVYARNDREPDKWWVCFAKRKFLNKTL